MNRIPNPNEYKTSCYIKNVVKAPNIKIGEYTYYDDPIDPTQFDNTMYCLIGLSLGIS